MGWKERVIAERDDLHTKMEALGAFLRSNNIADVPMRQQRLLARQEDVMRDYLSILNERLEEK